MQKKGSFTRIIALLLAVLIMGSVLVGVISTAGRASAAASQAQVNKLKDEKSSIEKKKEELQSQLNSLEYSQKTTLEKKEVLDEQVELTEENIANLEEQITAYEALIAEKEEEIAQLQEKEKEQWATYEMRIRAMEENGKVSYFEILFSANSFSDLLARISDIGEIMQYDEQVYQDIVDTRQATEDAKASLEEAKAAMEESKAELEAEKAELEQQVAESAALLEQIESDMDEYQRLYEEAQAEENNIQSEIDKMVKELEERAKAEEEARKNGSSSGSGSSVIATGTFIWPAPASNIITSVYGTRLHPIYHTYRTHNGIDIGASYGTNVLAADSGTVITSQYSSSYGNYIVLYHSNGTTTLYAHMSQRLVSVGQTVSQGDVIGLVGSTGNSTGPHLHFEVSVGGSRTNPLNYFSSDSYVIR